MLKVFFRRSQATGGVGMVSSARPRSIVAVMVVGATLFLYGPQLCVRATELRTVVVKLAEKQIIQHKPLSEHSEADVSVDYSTLAIDDPYIFRYNWNPIDHEHAGPVGFVSVPPPPKSELILDFSEAFLEKTTAVVRGLFPGGHQTPSSYARGAPSSLFRARVPRAPLHGTWRLDLQVVCRPYGLFEVTKLPREVEGAQVLMARIGRHGENAEGCGPAGRIDSPRYGQVANDRLPAAQCEKIRSPAVASAPMEASGSPRDPHRADRASTRSADRPRGQLPGDPRSAHTSGGSRLGRALQRVAPPSLPATVRAPRGERDPGRGRTERSSRGRLSVRPTLSIRKERRKEPSLRLWAIEPGRYIHPQVRPGFGVETFDISTRSP